jgi:hypothetical protein
MTHEYASETQAVERYLLNEMSRDERLSFEEHYFECGSCAELLINGQDFITAIKATNAPGTAVFDAKSRPRARPIWWKRWSISTWIPAAATLCLLLLVTVENLVTIPGLQKQVAESRSLQDTTVITAGTTERGFLSEHLTIPTTYVTVMFVLPDGALFPYYRVDLASVRNLILSRVLPAPNPNEPLAISVRKSSLGAGKLKATVSGLQSGRSSAGVRLEDYEFNIQ